MEQTPGSFNYYDVPVVEESEVAQPGPLSWQDHIRVSGGALGTQAYDYGSHVLRSIGVLEPLPPPPPSPPVEPTWQDSLQRLSSQAISYGASTLRSAGVLAPLPSPPRAPPPPPAEPSWPAWLSTVGSSVGSSIRDYLKPPNQSTQTASFAAASTQAPASRSGSPPGTSGGYGLPRSVLRPPVSSPFPTNNPVPIRRLARGPTSSGFPYHASYKYTPVCSSAARKYTPSQPARNPTASVLYMPQGRNDLTDPSIVYHSRVVPSAYQARQHPERPVSTMSRPTAPSRTSTCAGNVQHLISSGSYRHARPHGYAQASAYRPAYRDPRNSSRYSYVTPASIGPHQWRHQNASVRGYLSSYASTAPWGLTSGGSNYSTRVWQW